MLLERGGVLLFKWGEGLTPGTRSPVSPMIDPSPLPCTLRHTLITLVPTLTPGPARGQSQPIFYIKMALFVDRTRALFERRKLERLDFRFGCGSFKGKEGDYMERGERWKG